MEKVFSLLDQGKLLEAETLVLGLPPEGKTYHLLGLLAYKKSQLGLALEYLRKAVSLGYNTAELKLCMSAALCELGEYQQAENLFNSVAPR
jgi:Flp pilus assembly protein TadD